MNKCKCCNNELFSGENTIGKPFEYDICSSCWEVMGKSQREFFMKDGVVPITRSLVTDSWRKFCEKYRMTP